MSMCEPRGCACEKELLKSNIGQRMRSEAIAVITRAQAVVRQIDEETGD